MRPQTLFLLIVASTVLYVFSPRTTLAAPPNVITVTNKLDETSNGNGCSLREAIINSNNNNQTHNDCAAGSGTDEIRFAIGSGAQTIAPNSALPIVSEPVIIDGTTQPSCNAPCIVLDGVNAGGSSDGLGVNAGNSTIKGLVIQRFVKNGISMWKRGGNVIVGNFIGTDITGTLDRGNGLDGIRVLSANNRVGGPGAGERNLLSGNGEAGLLFCCSSVAGDNTAVNNYVGTNIQGSAAIQNDLFGLGAHSTNNRIGGTTPAERNLVSGNGEGGISLCCDAGASGNLIIGNWVGVDSTGTYSIRNFDAGIGLYAPNNVIGGDTPGERNVISGNRNTGINICCDSRANGNLIQGNYIGSNAAGTTGMSNIQVGVYVIAVANTTIGGTAPGTGNKIAFNDFGGVRVTTGSEVPLPVGYRSAVRMMQELGALPSDFSLPETLAELVSQPPIQNRIQRNSIYANKLLGIDIDSVGVMENDPLDADSGPNLRQNYPLINSASAATRIIKGKLQATPNSTYTIEFFTTRDCDETGHGEGKKFLGAISVTTNARGAAKLLINLKKLKPGHSITATATDASGNTSEFSRCRTVS